MSTSRVGSRVSTVFEFRQRCRRSAIRAAASAGVLFLVGGGSVFATILPIGQITGMEPPEPCPFSGTTAECQAFRVRCDETQTQEQAVLEVRTVLPDGAVIGTVVLLSGGGGGAFWTNAYGLIALDHVSTPLLEAGYQLIEIRWPDRWLNGITDPDLTPPAEQEFWEGQANLACRVATMIDWVHTNKHPPGLPFCGTGQSGGSSQIAYTLTHYGMDTLWDAVVLTGGPPHANLAHGCWGSCTGPEEGCHSGRTKCSIDWAYGNPEDNCLPPIPATSYGPCQDDTFGSPAEAVFNEQSVAVDPNGEWDYENPTTVVWFIIGELDPGSSPWQQDYYFDKLVDAGETPIGNGGMIEVVDQVEHNVPAFEEGADRIFLSLMEICGAP